MGSQQKDVSTDLFLGRGIVWRGVTKGVPVTLRQRHSQRKGPACKGICLVHVGTRDVPHRPRRIGEGGGTAGGLRLTEVGDTCALVDSENPLGLATGATKKWHIKWFHLCVLKLKLKLNLRHLERYNLSPTLGGRGVNSTLLKN